MTKLLQTLIPLLLCIASFLMLANKAVSYETFFRYIPSRSKLTNLTYQGDAHIPDGASFLRLTKTDSHGSPQKFSVGRVLYSKPVRLWERLATISFNTTIKFTITPTKGHPPADGLAFFIAPVGTTIPKGSYGGNLGLFDSSGSRSSSFFAVEFDLYANDWDPSDGRAHIGIDINSLKSSSFVKIGDKCVGKEVELNIHYDGGGGLIYVVLKCGGQIRLLEYEYNLISILPYDVQVGISASTGDLVALHDVNYWSFKSTMRVLDDDSKTSKIA